MCRPLARLASAIGALARGRNSFEPCNQCIPCPSYLSHAALACNKMFFNFIRLPGTSFQGTGEHLKMLFSLHLAFLEGLHWPYEFVQVIQLLYRNSWKMILKYAIFGGHDEMGKTPGKWLLQEYPPPSENVSLWWVTGSRKIEYISMYGTEKCLRVPQLEPMVSDL